MATPAADSAAAIAASESGDASGGLHQVDNDSKNSECLDDPNFAIVCSFLEKFGTHIRLGEFPFDELQSMLENTNEVPDLLVKLHLALLRRVYKAVTPDKWERSLAKFGHSYNSQDAWEIERFGYKKAKLQTKLRILKNLLEAQFDYNVKFKAEVNKLQAEELRLVPMGRDCLGQQYWYQVDNDANLRVYCENVDDETWEVVASTREKLCELIAKLQKGDIKGPNLEAIVVDEDSNEMEIEANDIIRDTGKDEDIKVKERNGDISLSLEADTVSTKSVDVTDKVSSKDSTKVLGDKFPVASSIINKIRQLSSEDDYHRSSDEMEIDESYQEPEPLSLIKTEVKDSTNEQTTKIKHRTTDPEMSKDKMQIVLKENKSDLKEPEVTSLVKCDKMPETEEVAIKAEMKVRKSEQLQNKSYHIKQKDGNTEVEGKQSISTKDTILSEAKVLSEVKADFVTLAKKSEPVDVKEKVDVLNATNNIEKRANILTCAKKSEPVHNIKTEGSVTVAKKSEPSPNGKTDTVTVAKKSEPLPTNLKTVDTVTVAKKTEPLANVKTVDSVTVAKKSDPLANLKTVHTVTVAKKSEPLGRVKTVDTVTVARKTEPLDNVKTVDTVTVAKKSEPVANLTTVETANVGKKTEPIPEVNIAATLAKKSQPISTVKKVDVDSIIVAKKSEPTPALGITHETVAIARKSAPLASKETFQPMPVLTDVYPVTASNKPELSSAVATDSLAPLKEKDSTVTTGNLKVGFSKEEVKDFRATKGLESRHRETAPLDLSEKSLPSLELEKVVTPVVAVHTSSATHETVAPTIPQTEITYPTIPKVICETNLEKVGPITSLPNKEIPSPTEKGLPLAHLEKVTPSKIVEKASAFTSSEVKPLANPKSFTTSSTPQKSAHFATSQRGTSLGILEKITSSLSRQKDASLEKREKEKEAFFTTSEKRTSPTSEKISLSMIPDKVALPQALEKVVPSVTTEKVPSEALKKPAPSKLAEEIERSKALEKVEPSKTPEKVKPSKTPENVASSESLEKVVPSKTPDEVAPSEAIEKVSPYKIAEEVGPSKTSEKVKPSKSPEKVIASKSFKEVAQPTFLEKVGISVAQEKGDSVKTPPKVKPISVSVKVDSITAHKEAEPFSDSQNEGRITTPGKFAPAPVLEKLGPTAISDKVEPCTTPKRIDNSTSSRNSINATIQEKIDRPVMAKSTSGPSGYSQKPEPLPVPKKVDSLLARQNVELLIVSPEVDAKTVSQSKIFINSSNNADSRSISNVSQSTGVKKTSSNSPIKKENDKAESARLGLPVVLETDIRASIISKETDIASVEKEVTKTAAWVCGNKNNSDAKKDKNGAATEAEVNISTTVPNHEVEEKLTKTQAWVCGSEDKPLPSTEPLLIQDKTSAIHKSSTDFLDAETPDNASSENSKPSEQPITGATSLSSGAVTKMDSKPSEPAARATAVLPEIGTEKKSDLVIGSVKDETTSRDPSAMLISDAKLNPKLSENVNQHESGHPLVQNLTKIPLIDEVQKVKESHILKAETQTEAKLSITEPHVQLEPHSNKPMQTKELLEKQQPLPEGTMNVVQESNVIKTTPLKDQQNEQKQFLLPQVIHPVTEKLSVEASVETVKKAPEASLTNKNPLKPPEIETGRSKTVSELPFDISGSAVVQSDVPSVNTSESKALPPLSFSAIKPSSENISSFAETSICTEDLLKEKDPNLTSSSTLKEYTSPVVVGLTKDTVTKPLVIQPAHATSSEGKNANEEFTKTSSNNTKPSTDAKESSVPIARDSLSNTNTGQKIITPLQHKIELPKPALGGLSGLVSYDSSSEDESEETPQESMSTKEKSISGDAILISSAQEKVEGSEGCLKRKAEERIETVSKIPRIGEVKGETSTEKPFNPIVGEAIEEEVMQITGEGSGAQNEGGNGDVLVEENQKENIKGNNANSAKETKSKEQVEQSSEEQPSSNEDSEEEESIEVPKPPQKTRGRKPKSRRNKPGPKPSSTPGERKPRSNPSSASKSRREIARLGVPLDTLEVNGSADAVNDRPVRASRRIAQIRQKEEEERRKLEEERLAQLKAAQIRKQQKKATLEKERQAAGIVSVKSPKKSGSKKSKDKLAAAVDYLPSPSVSDSESQEDDGDDYENKKEKPKKKKKTANGKHKGGNPWATSSSEEDSEAVEEEEEYHYEEEEQLVFNESDHEFSPESDLSEDEEARPSRHARTAKRGEVDKVEETGCMKCSKGDHPEWILLCDKCDQGWHANCLKPVLWVIPEGEWFCPPCQHNMLVNKLNESLVEYDKLFKRRENDILRKQRLAYVGISLDNVLPEKTEEEKSTEEKVRRKEKERERRVNRRRILSDEELSDTFINDRSDGKSDQSTEESEDEPIYRLRARRTAKTFDYKEYDEMINSALRASDDELGEMELETEAGADSATKNNGDVNGEGETEPIDTAAPVVEQHSGKNEAYEKHLEEAEGHVETDEELLDEKERLRRKELKKAGNKKKKRSFRDLDDYTDEDNSDEDFKGSDAEDDEELDEDAAEDDESEWSGDKDDSDDSLALKSRSRGKKGKYGRREQYLDVGPVRRSTRRRKARVSYDESDQDEDEEEGEDKWHSDQSEEDEETPSESDDETYGKRKKKKPTPARSAVPRFFLGAMAISNKGKKSSSSSKKKRRKVDEDDEDRAWSSSQGSKAKKKAAEEQVERRTRGRKINFKDILDSGESDDDGNIRPKRRRISSDDDDEDEAETSRRLAEEIKAANQREAAMYAAQQKQGKKSPATTPAPTIKAEEDEKQMNNKSEDIVLPKVENVLNSNKNSSEPVKTEMVQKDKDAELELEMARAKPVRAPPLPPSLAKALARTHAVQNSKPVLTAPAGPGEPNSLKAIFSQPIGPPTTTVTSKAPVTVASGSAGTSPVPHGPPAKTPPLPIPPPVTSVPHVSVSNSPAISPTPAISITPTPTNFPHNTSNSPTTTTTTSSKKGSKSSLSNPPTSLNSHMRPMTPTIQHSHGLPPGLPPGLPIDISRVPNPALYQGNPAIRPYSHAMWGRNAPPPPYGAPPTSIGKPPPLNSTPFLSQHGPPRPGYPSPPPLRIPNPNTSPLQAFHFKRDPHGPGIYRLPPGQSGPGGLPGILAAGLVSHQGSVERFFGGPPTFPPYGILPPHTQSQQLFSATPFDFRTGEPFKEESRRTPPGTSSPPVSQGPPTTSSSSSSPPPSVIKDETSEFGGLVSYFSSQRSEEDMDT